MEWIPVLKLGPIAGVLLVSSSVFAFELKGFAPGKPITEVKAMYPQLDCSGNFEGRKNCHYIAKGITPNIDELNTFAGVPVTSWFLEIDDDRVAIAGLSLPSTRFDHVTGAIAEKYGPPTKRETSTLKTRAGVEYEQIMLTWLEGDESLLATKFGGDIKSMRVTVTSKKYQDAALARRDAKKKAGAKDM